MEAATLTPLARGRRALATDEKLVAATRLGDDGAFETLYHRYHRRINAYVLGMVKDHQRAEDVTQEIFMSALRRMRATDRDIVFKPWIYEIAKNACIDQFRRARRTDEVSYDADGEEGGVAPLVSKGLAPDEAVESRKQLDDLCGAFGGLSDSHHKILVLRELEGRSYQEIGERMQMTRPAVESTLFRARKRLGEEYGELVSGERCQKVQAIISTASEGSLGVRDKRTMARHVSHCQPCRRAVAMAGLTELVPARTGVRAKIAAAIPLPAFLRDRWLGVGSQHAAGAADGGAAGVGLMGWLHAAAPMADNASGWVKAVAATVTVAVAGVGAGAVATHNGGDDRPAPPSAQQGKVTRAGGQAVATRAATASTPAGAARSSSSSSTARPESTKTSAQAPVEVSPSSGLGQAGQTAAASGDTAAKRTGSSGTTSSASAALPATPADAAVDHAADTADSTASSTKDTVSTATQGVKVTPPVPVVPSIPPVGDTPPTVPSLGDVTNAVGDTVDQTLQGVQGAVDDAQDGLKGAATGGVNLSPGG